MRKLSVLLTHLHADHIGGAFSGRDSLFPKAKVFIFEGVIHGSNPCAVDFATREIQWAKPRLDVVNP
jgi:glyoxylase-like metal-dependent hydrolase (beta-lactamase superfamily II)